MATDSSIYRPLQPTGVSYLVLFLVLVAATLTGAWCAYTMEHAGHHITGMNNRIVWGLPHVFAISLIVTASGALNAATMSSVFAIDLYNPYARLSVMLALAMLAGGLAVLVLDLGRPDRLVIALTTYNFRSIFSWNIYLYTGFMVVGVVYLWMILERRFNRFSKTVGVIAFAWRLILTTGTGSIFGFLVGRSALDSAILAPLFIALSLVMGTAVLVLVIVTIARWQQSTLSENVLNAFAKLLFWSLVALVYFSVVQHLTNLYVAQHHGDEHLVLAGSFAALFWAGHIIVGVVLPLALLVSPAFANTRQSNGNTDRQPMTVNRLLVASAAALAGGMALVYTIVIGSQASAQVLFPGKTVVASSFGDAGIATYAPSLWEWGLGVGGVALSLLLLLLVLRILPLTPQLSQPVNHPGSEEAGSEEQGNAGQANSPADT